MRILVTVLLLASCAPLVAVAFQVAPVPVVVAGLFVVSRIIA